MTSVIHCIESKRLSIVYTSALSAYLRAQSVQVAAVWKKTDVVLAIYEAFMRQHEAKYALIAHQDGHGCGGI